MRLTLLFLLLILVCNGSYAQSLILKGKIVNSKGLPVPFASVYEKNTTSGTSANSDGEFQLKLKPGKRSLIFKAIGFSQESRELD
ncbi:MAG: carboxypeptidase-like regulatory domain-containing protein, partial [Sphingobacterium thalpophilum]